MYYKRFTLLGVKVVDHMDSCMVVIIGTYSGEDDSSIKAPVLTLDLHE